MSTEQVTPPLWHAVYRHMSHQKGCTALDGSAMREAVETTTDGHRLPVLDCRACGRRWVVRGTRVRKLLALLDAQQPPSLVSSKATDSPRFFLQCIECDQRIHCHSPRPRLPLHNACARERATARKRARAAILQRRLKAAAV